MRLVRLFFTVLFIAFYFTSCNQPAPNATQPELQSNPDAKITATIYNSGFEHAHDTYNGISTASDGKVYYVLCSQLMDVAGQMYSFDPKSNSIEHLGDLTEICGEKDMKVVAQGKSHVNFVEMDGKLYFATHLGYYSIIDGMEKTGVPTGDYKPYRGGHLLAYDMKTKIFEDLGIGPNKEGIITMNMDPARGLIYGLSWPTGIFFRYDVASKRMEDLGPITGKGEDGMGENFRVVCRSLAINPDDGAVYMTTAEGDIKYLKPGGTTIETIEGENMKKEYFGTYDIFTSGSMAYNWRQVFWYGPEKKVYGVHGNSGYLFRFDPSVPRIDTPEKAFEAGIFFKTNDIDLCFIYLPSYVASGRYLIGAMQVCCPIVLVGHQVQFEVGQIQITEAIGFGGPCCVTEAYNALERCGIEAKDFVFGRQSGKWFDTAMTKQINEWCRVADALRAYKGAIFGHMGHSYEGMLDMNFDPTAFTRSFGVHIRMLEMCELVEYVQGATKTEIKEKMDEMNETFTYLDPSYDLTTVPINPEDIEWAAQCAVGLDKLVVNNNLSAMAYYYEGRDNIYERIASNLIIGNSLLVSRGIALAGESDMKTCMAMYTTSAIGAGGSFAEYGIDLADNIMLVGHDGPHDIRISDGKPTIRGLGLYHGKRGHGISVEFSLKTGPMTMLGLSADINGRFRFIGAEADSERGPLPQMGNSMTRAHLTSDVKKFMVDWAKAGNTHHMSLCVGQQTGVIEKLCKALPDVTFKKVE